jgi:hypothetical protein
MMKPRAILSVLMLVSGLAILLVSCRLFSWYSWNAARESALFAFIGVANVLGAWRFWRVGVVGNPAPRLWQQSALLLIPALTLYLAGYAFLGFRVCGFKDPQNGATYCGFVYRYGWESRLFVPAAAAESLLFQRNIATGTEDELTWTSPVREAAQEDTADGESVKKPEATLH